MHNRYVFSADGQPLKALCDLQPWIKSPPTRLGGDGASSVLRSARLP